MCANDALLLIGHGSARYPEAGRAMHRHADTLRAGGQFAQVQAALLNGAPSAADALAQIDAATIRVVPFFMEDGYFSQAAVPQAVQAGLGANAGARRIIMCRPVGVHDGMAGLVERQALALCDTLGLPSRDVAVLLAGHGSAKAPGRAMALHRHASRVAATELFARVEAACLEEPPFIADALHGLRSHPVVVIGFFANYGGHVRDDLPARIATEQAARDPSGHVPSGHARSGHAPSGHAVQFYGCVADDPAMTEIILDQARNGR